MTNKISLGVGVIHQGKRFLKLIYILGIYTDLVQLGQVPVELGGLLLDGLQGRDGVLAEQRWNRSLWRI